MSTARFQAIADLRYVIGARAVGNGVLHLLVSALNKGGHGLRSVVCGEHGRIFTAAAGV
jgi:hypothetical protein